MRRRVGPHPLNVEAIYSMSEQRVISKNVHWLHWVSRTIYKTTTSSDLL